MSIQSPVSPTNSEIFTESVVVKCCRNKDDTSREDDLYRFYTPPEVS